ncbi:MAG: glycine oxidase ThiO [Polyangiaceae bacterium]
MSDDVVVIGGGAIGCAAALSLARRGMRVRVLERAHPGAEASSAAAGILGAYAEAHDTGPLTRLFFASLAMYPAWTAGLTEATGIDTGYRPSGSMRAYLDAGAFERAAEESAAAFGEAARAIDGGEARGMEPALSEAIAGAVLFPADCRIDPPALLRAIEGAARRARVTFDPPAEVTGLRIEGDRAVGAVLASGEEVRAGAVVLAAGAWSLLPGCGLSEKVIEPVRGQMMELRAIATAGDGERRLLDRVVFGPDAYLSPRDDGRILVGATVERAGFRKAVTARGIHGLLGGAMALVPALAEAEIARTWAGLRPATPDGAPLIGRGHVRGLVVAAGHFRNGILLSPLTGELVAELVLGEEPRVDLSPFAVDRFAREMSPAP